MNKTIILCCLALAACGGQTYQSVFDGYRAEGKTFGEALAAADQHCLNNPCAWGR